ncbi:hypothetical protein Ancab_026200 [Ancistrocladus abbreviatus]
MDHELGGQTTGLAGTWGYMAPEYISTRKASKESDVYSFGIVALEIATGKKSVDTMSAECQKGLLECVWDLCGQGRLLSAVDERLQMDYEEKQPSYGYGLAFFMAPVGFQIPPNLYGGFLGLFNTTTSNSTRNQIGVMILGGNIIALIYWKKRKSKKENLEVEGLISFNDELERGARPRRFSYVELASATNNFSAKRKLGEVGFGGVYKGYLTDINMAIAVKKFSRRTKDGKTQYTTEVKVISRLTHRNLVQLICWCHEKGELLLVYVFMPNGSLDSHLFGKRAPLSWSIWYKVALGLSSALLYLHEEWEQCVMHRDIKSSNIMLDSSFNVKLGDFDLARLMDHELGTKTTCLAGTWGYMAPEYITTRKASKETDVYSFGVVVLEIATGKRPCDVWSLESLKGLVEWAWDHYGYGELLSIVGERLQMTYDAKQVECLMVFGLWCAHPDSRMRPSMKQAIQVLKFEAMMPSLPEKMPIAGYNMPNKSAVSTEASFTTSILESGYQICFCRNW